jgi:DeoR/GlpR family transcriptional regulator of sugar metabolism
MPLAAERRQRIADALERDGRVQAALLAAELGVSIDTLRRDLDALAAEGLLRRVHGGALPLRPVPPSYAERTEQRVSEKQAIARAALAVLPTEGTLLVGGGTTALELARVLPGAFRGTVLTTAVDTAAALAGRPGIEVLVPGGTLHPQARTLTGADTVDAVRAVHADACVISACSLHLEAGLTGHVREEAAVERAMIDASAQAVVLATTDKLGFVATHAVAPATAVTNLVAHGPAELEPFREAGIAVTAA